MCVLARRNREAAFKRADELRPIVRRLRAQGVTTARASAGIPAYNLVIVTVVSVLVMILNTLLFPLRVQPRARRL